MLHDKSGQVTVFVIIAAFLIIAVGTTLYIQQQDTTMDSELVRSRLPNAAQPVFEYVKSCMDQVGEQGIRTMAEKGGYIEHNLRTDPLYPTQGEAVALSPQSDLEVPYWYHMRSDDACEQSCSFSTARPPLRKPLPGNMESQLDTYMDEHLLACLDGFSLFTEEGWTLADIGEITTDTTITAEGVNFYVEYPISLVKDDVRVDVDEFATTLNVRLQDMYNLGRLLADAEEEYAYIERNMYQLISLNQGPEAHQLPPHYDVKVTNKAPTMWVKRDIKQRVQDLLSAYIPLMQVFGTSNYQYIEAPQEITGQESRELYEQLYNRNMLVLPSLEEDYPNIEASFVYLPWWEPYFDMNCRGELCKGEHMMSTFIIPIGVQRYLFSYDISIPVLVRMRDPDAFEGKGMDFQYMLEGNLRNSEPASKDAEVIYIEEVSESLFCDANKRTGTRVKINVTDASTGLPLDATVTFQCGSETLSDGCAIGESEDGYLNVKLPKCLGGYLSVQQQDYASFTMPMDSDLQETKELNVALEPVREINFELRRYIIERQMGWQLDPNVKYLSPEEESLITLSRVTQPGEDPWQAVAVIYGNQITNAQRGEWRNISMLPGTYEVEINTFLYPNYPLIIPPQIREYKGGIFGDGGSYAIPQQPIIFDYKNPMPYGGAKFTFTVTGEQLDENDILQFYTIDFALDRIPETSRVIEDLQQMGRYEEYSVSHRQLIEPQLLP